MKVVCVLKNGCVKLCRCKKDLAKMGDIELYNCVINEMFYFVIRLNTKADKTPDFQTGSFNFFAPIYVFNVNN
jgi:hypothetical protein